MTSTKVRIVAITIVAAATLTASTLPAHAVEQGSYHGCAVGKVTIQATGGLTKIYYMNNTFVASYPDGGPHTKKTTYSSGSWSVWAPNYISHATAYCS